MTDKKLQTSEGGVTAAQGFVAGSASCQIQESAPGKRDLALIFSQATPTVAAATFTTNKIKAAPVKVSMAHMRSPEIRAVIANSGNANACTGYEGIENAKRMARGVAKLLGVGERQVLVCSTGRIGVPMPIEKIERTLPALTSSLTREGSRAAAKAIMTSDTFPKDFTVRTEIDGNAITVGGIAKGAGMINPNMATMLCVITTDAAIQKEMLQKALNHAVEQSFNRITVDGDMSTNDTVIVLANGGAGNRPLKRSHPQLDVFQNALNIVTRNLARMIVEDGEGMTKCVEVSVRGAATFQDARHVAEAVANSALVKCAWHGNDPNWGRIVDAVGYSSAKVREEMIDVFYDGVIAVKNGVASETPLAELKRAVSRERFRVTIDLHLGSADYIAYTTDLTPEYVRFNMGE